MSGCWSGGTEEIGKRAASRLKARGKEYSRQRMILAVQDPGDLQILHDQAVIMGDRFRAPSGIRHEEGHVPCRAFCHRCVRCPAPDDCLRRQRKAMYFHRAGHGTAGLFPFPNLHRGAFSMCVGNARFRHQDDRALPGSHAKRNFRYLNM